MKRFIAGLCVILSILSLTACSSTSDVATLPLVPMLAEPVDPDDSVMRESVTAFLQETGAPIASMYEFRRVDLDKDGRRDALVLFKNPYGYWCDTHGCTMLVLKADNEKFELVNAIQPVRAPLYVSENKTNGWNDIIINVTGRWSESKHVAMMYNGKNYPDNPDTLPAYIRVASAGSQRLFY